MFAAHILPEKVIIAVWSEEKTSISCLFAEDGDDCKAACGSESSEETHQVEGDFREGGNGHPAHDGHEGEVGEGGVPRAQDDSCDHHSEDWHGCLDCVCVRDWHLPYGDVCQH